MTIEVLLDLVNAICKIAFIAYAWKTMLHINTYIKEHRKDGDDE